MNILLSALLIGCLVLLQCLIGGTRLVFSFPGYTLAAVAAVLSVAWIRRPLPKLNVACLISTLLLAGYIFCRAWFSPVPYLARADAFMVAGALLVYLLTTLYVHESRPRLWIVTALLAVAMVHIGVGVLQFRDLNGFMLFGFLRGDNDWRASGMLICPNHLAGYLESIALLALSLTFWSRCRPAIKLVTAYIALACYLGVMLTGSRGGYLSAMGSLVVFAGLSGWVIKTYRSRKSVYFFVGVIGTGVVLLCNIGFLLAQNASVQQRMYRLTEATKDVRIYNWQATLDQFRQSPVVGTGAGTHLYYGRLFRRPQIQADPIHSHSDYLELLAEYGIVGALLALAFLGTHLLNGIRCIREITYRRLCKALVSARSDTLALTLGAITAVSAILAHSLVDFNLHIPGNALLFAFLFGVLGQAGIDVSAPVGSWKSPEFLLRAGLAVLGAATLGAIGFRYSGEQRTEQARVALRDGDYQACLAAAELAIKADASNPHSYFYQGEALRVTAGRMPHPALRSVYFNKAVDSYRSGLEQFPQDENLLIRLGQALDGALRVEEADEVYRQAIAQDPNLGILYAFYAAHFHLIGQPVAAQQCLTVAKRLGTRNPASVGMAEVQSILNAGSVAADQK